MQSGILDKFNFNKLQIMWIRNQKDEETSLLDVDMQIRLCVCLGPHTYMHVGLPKIQCMGG